MAVVLDGTPLERAPAQPGAPEVGAAADGAAERSAADRRDALKAVYREASGCMRCPALAEQRQSVVFGAGNADADLMFVGEAPGANEDRLGLPFVGRAGKLLDSLLEGIGLQRADVFIANVIKCRPPGNRDPLPGEIEHCSPYLLRQIELIEPRVVCTLGNFSTKLLRDDSTGITRLHGQAEIRVIGGRAVRLYPLFHPAAALYTPRTLEVLREDFERLPELLALGAPPQPEPVAVARDPASPPAEEPAPEPSAQEPAPEPSVEEPASQPQPPSRAGEPAAEPSQLGLFG